MFGDNISFKINNRQPVSNRVTRDYDLQAIEYRSYNENKTVRLLLRGLKETYKIKLYDWTNDDITAFNLIETSANKNLCTFQPSLDKTETKQCYFEYYIDPFKKVLNIELTPVFLLNYSALPAGITYIRQAQVFGNTVNNESPKLGGYTLPDRTTIKISVDYEITEKISITGKIHREYFYQSDKAYKKIKFTGASTGITDTVYNQLYLLQGDSQVLFSVNGFNYKTVPVLKFLPILKNLWVMNFDIEVQEEYIPVNIFYLAHELTTAPAMPEGCIFYFSTEI